MSKDNPVGHDVLSSPETSENQKTSQTELTKSPASQLAQGDETQELSEFISENSEIEIISESEETPHLGTSRSQRFNLVVTNEPVAGPSGIQVSRIPDLQETAPKLPEQPEQRSYTSCMLYLIKCCCCGMGMKLKCFESNERSNSYSLLENLGENKDTSTEKQEELHFFNDDGTYTDVVVEKDLRVFDLCNLLAIKNRVGKELSWCIIEHWIETGAERILEDHEDILAVHKKTERAAKKFIFRRVPKKYEFFDSPDGYFPAGMLEFRDEDCEGHGESKADVIEKFVLENRISPTIYSQARILQSNKITWINFFLLLTESKILMSSKANIVANYLRHWKQNYKRLNEHEQNKYMLDKERSLEALQLLADLDQYEIYSCLNAKNHLKAPSEFGIILRKTSEEDFTSSIAFACESERDRTCWLAAMRLSKYGKQIRENYKAYLEKDEQIKLAQQNSSSELSNVSDIEESRVAMDFTGSIGRIVEDPTEAQAIAIAESTAARKRQWRRHYPKYDEHEISNAHLKQPWYHGGMTRENATAVVGAQYQDGVFLVRKSQSNIGCYVLSYKCSGKVIHAPITPMIDPVRDEVCFTLDNGVTKFFDLLQLIDFYKMNAGCLPLRLTHYIQKNTSPQLMPSNRPE